MPDVTDDDKNAMKDRVKTVTKTLNDSIDYLCVHPEDIGAVEDIVANSQRRNELIGFEGKLSE